jgi:meiosis induction protein kinase IME2/SME1
MAPHSLDTILRQPTWPASLSHFVTWCLMWDPKSRPTSTQALQHEYFRDAMDPLRPKSSSRLLGRKQSTISTQEPIKEAPELTPSITSKTSSWFRRSLITREISAPAVAQHAPPVQQPTIVPTPLRSTPDPSNKLSVRPNASKRATWTHGLSSNAAPIPILPSIRPVSPLSDAVTAQATVQRSHEVNGRKAGSQLSVASQYADIHRQEAEKALNGRNSGLTSPTSSQKEGFFSHLRKRARRFSGRYHTPISPNDDIESHAGAAQWSNRQAGDYLGALPAIPNDSGTFAELDKALQNVRSSIDFSKDPARVASSQHLRPAGNSLLKRHHSTGSKDTHHVPSIRHVKASHKATHKASHTNLQYETPDEEDELLHESLMSAHNAVQSLSNQAPPSWKNSNGLQPTTTTTQQFHQMYLTPSPSANRNSIHYGHTDYVSHSKPMDINRPRQPADNLQPKWPTPPYEESEWASSAAASILAAQSVYR